MPLIGMVWYGIFRQFILMPKCRCARISGPDRIVYSRRAGWAIFIRATKWSMYIHSGCGRCLHQHCPTQAEQRREEREWCLGSRFVLPRRISSSIVIHRFLLRWYRLPANAKYSAFPQKHRKCTARAIFQLQSLCTLPSVKVVRK